MTIKYSFIVSISMAFSITLMAKDHYLKVENLFDGQSWISPAYLHLENHIITYMGPFPHKDKFYHIVEKSTLMPPLVDAHQHLTIVDPHYGEDYEKAFRNSHQLSIEKKKDMALTLMNDYLHKGFLYIRDLGGDSAALSAIKREKLNRDYPTIQWSQLPIAHGRGQCPKDLPCSRYFQKSDDFKINPTDETVKVYLDNEPFDGAISSKDLTNILAYQNKAMAFHSIHPYPLENLIGKIDKRDSLEHIHYIKNKQLKLLAPTEVRLVPTDIPEGFIEMYKDKVSQWTKIEAKIQNTRAKKLQPYFEQICFGSDFYIKIHDPIRTQAYWAIESFVQLAQRLKLKTTPALKMITNQCAPLFPKEKNLGHIRVGEKANFIIVEGSLKEDLRNLHNILWVVKKGRILVRP